MKLNNKKRFMAWQDLILTPLVEIGIFGNATFATLLVKKQIPLSGLSTLLTWVIIETLVALLFLILIRKLFPLKPGFYQLRSAPWVYYNYKLQGFILIFNLYYLAFPNLIPIALRKPIYQMLGVVMKKGINIISGQLVDPFYMIRIDESATIGFQAIVLPHFLCVVDGEDVLILQPITIGKNAIVGANVVISPGVVVGEGAMVNAQSFVPMNTKIGPHEIWGGNPAVKLGSSTPGAPTAPSRTSPEFTPSEAQL